MNRDSEKNETTSSGAALVAGMGSCYALGTFTDNFYKQAAVLLAAGTQAGSMQSVATVLFSLPFIVFSAWAGWLADRMVKKHIVVAAKSMELAAMAVGGFMLVQGNWAGILAVIFCMGAQSTMFSPALNGSIPESFPAARVPRVNALIKSASTGAVLAGMALAGVFLDLTPEHLGGFLSFYDPSADAGDPSSVPVYGRIIASIFIVGIAVLGLLTAFSLRRPPENAAKKVSPPFPWSGPLDSVRHALECRGDPSLFLVLLAEAWFYGIAAVAVISIANLAVGLGYGNTVAGMITAVLMIGIAAGSLIAGKKHAESWRGLLLPSAMGVGIFLALTGLAPYMPVSVDLWNLNPQLCWIFACQALCGLCGGIYLIPLASYIQVRPAAHEKGRVLGVSNFMSFSAMALFGAAFYCISALPPPLTFAVYGLSTLAVARFFARNRLRRLQGASMREAASSPLAWLLRGLLALRYTVTERGLEAIAVTHDSRHPESTADSTGNSDKASVPGILFLPNHPALVDPVILYSRLAGLKPRPLADQRRMRGFLPGLAARFLQVIIIPDLQKEGKAGAAEAAASLESVIAALRQGDNVLLYPSGRIYRSARESLGANSAVSRILAAIPDVRVVLARTSGLWGSSFSHAAGTAPDFTRQLLRGLMTILSNLMFFTPRRAVALEFAEPGDLPRDGDKMRLNSYLEAFYNREELPAVAVPRRFWQDAAPLPAPDQARASTPSPAAVPDDVRRTVYRLIRECSDLPRDQPLSGEDSLTADAHMDSLALAELAAALECEFGRPVPNLESLVTVEDCLLAAMGESRAGDAGGAENAVPAAWFAPADSSEASRPLVPVKTANTVVEAFLALARQYPSFPMLADRAGQRSRRQVLVGVLALSRRFRRLPEKRLGIMLPAVPAAVIVWLAAFLAGKEPVMLNWTVGPRNMRHCIAATGIRRALTSSLLLDQLRRTGNPIADTDVEWLPVENLAAGLSLWNKSAAAARAALHCLGLFPIRARHTSDIAAVLFTSGSESNPKAVPLSHRNIMANAGDILAVLRVRGRDCLLAMLPPFHSFGLMAGLALPAIAGLRAVYHPNPTESLPLLDLARRYKITLLGATPTFLDAMISRAGSAGDLASLRFAFVGAEKCPERIYKAFAACCPDAALCEGYGITECSPVISINSPDDIVPGSIGFPLPSVHTAVVVEEEDAQGRVVPLRRAQAGEAGMLLVRGKSVFSGYIGDAPDPFVGFEGERWYRTGDIIAQDASGRLVFKGRLKRFVKLGGEMLSLPQMEEILQNALKSRPDLPEDDTPFIAVEAGADSEDGGQTEIFAFSTLPLAVHEVNRMFRDAGLASIYAVKRVIRVPEIPLLGSGKTDYRALQALGRLSTD
ncbi:MAG: MFS transporter [Desulfovibrio sp.]|jgi:acyl-CoA synthetase (AMP-forming)/AMP-acid ligase II/MFS family permease/acyl carrier protein|nr:MFS transporter [Desulfovibrio sp.]